MISLVYCATPFSDGFSCDNSPLASKSSQAILEASQGPVRWLGLWISADTSVIFGVTRPFGHEIFRDEYVLVFRLNVRRKQEGGRMRTKIGLKVGKHAAMM